MGFLPSDAKPEENILLGWVYIIVNKSMPGVVKVGYTDRSPAKRASELGGTGMPTPYSVAYSVRLHDARKVEQQVHRKLAKAGVGKEWFRCTVATARTAIENVADIENLSSNSPLVPGHPLHEYFE
jgi:hypothetical protein